ncbi:glycosyl transferase [Acinetobacter defluvii]|uniref:glycosyltransferase n=1 Tax=Acinetobacter defluvii TaxID=1871111 RepID=UPI00148FA76F|nr:glycosyltransferase [Acinetobacter defluvii]NNP74034.1 glycosyl transferase [Acinetobacter defluvii]
MKILFIITSLGMGGAENVLANLTDGLVQRGCEVKIICLKGEVLVKPQCDKVEIVSLNFDSLSNLYSILKSIKTIIQNYQPDIVHAHMFHAIVIARLLRITTPIKKLICTAHSKAFGGKARAMIYRVTDRWSDLNTNVSIEATENFIEHKIFKKNNSCTITNGINTEKFVFNLIDRIAYRTQFKIENNEKIFIAIGRFNEAKDYPNLINAFNLFREKSNVESKLLIVGDGELRQSIENLIIDTHLSDQIILLGIRNDIPQLLSMADFFVLSSAWEGFGLVVAEAMATERVVIATDCGGVKEVLGAEDFLVEPQNPIKLAEKMLHVVQLNDLDCGQIGKINKQRVVNHYSLDAMVAQWLKVYKS